MTRSGNRVAVSQTRMPDTTTPMFATTSARVKIQLARKWTSPDRKGLSMRKTVMLTASESSATAIIQPLAGSLP